MTLDPGEREHYRLNAREERDRRDFVAWLEAHEHVTDVRPRHHAIDFHVGDQLDDYPDHFDDDHLNVISGSAVATRVWGVDKRWAGIRVNELKVHLPAAPEHLRDAVDDALDLPDGTAVHYGTGALGGMPAPDGVITPHVLHTEALPYDTARAAVDTCADVYADVYDAGARAIKEVPDA